MKKIHFMILTILIMLMVPLTALGDSDTEYRALLIGNAYYHDSDANLVGPINDLVKMEEAMNNNYFGSSNKKFKSISTKSDQTAIGIIESIEMSFKGATENDVSYFYYSGHGDYDYYTGVSNLVGVDGYGVDVHELESALSKVPGKVVVILDSCNSGGFISRNAKVVEKKVKGNSKNIKEYNDSVIEAFSDSKSRDYLTKGKYKVITASAEYEYSYEYPYDDGWGGAFTRAFVEGIGYNGKFLSDSNDDNNVSLSEIYNYTKNHVPDSSVQVYPKNDNFVIASDFIESVIDNTSTLKWKDFHDVKLDKTWTVNFSDKIQNTNWEDKVYILDKYNNVVETTVSRNADGKSLKIQPIGNYKSDSKYSLWIEDKIYSQAGKKHNDKILLNFYTEKTVIEEVPEVPEEPEYPDYEDYEAMMSLNIVKNGNFYYYPNPSVSQAFNSFFGDPRWEYFKSVDNLDIVEFNGGVYRDEIPGNLVMQFEVDIWNGEFEVVYTAFEYGPYEDYIYDDELDSLLYAIYDSYNGSRTSKDLKDVFNTPTDVKEKYNLSDRKIKK